MKRFIVYLLAMVGALTVGLIILLIWASQSFIIADQGNSEKISHKTVLVLQVGNTDLKESPSSSSPFNFSLSTKNQHTLKDVLQQLEHASTDDRVKGLLLVVEGGALGIAQTQELRVALANFRKNGKFVYAFAETFGEFDNGTMAYYLATAADKIWLQPSGTIGLTGLIIEIPFAKDAIDNLKLIPRIERREQYKSMPDSMTENDFTPAHRENMQNILDNITKQLTADMAKGRNIDVKTMEGLINQGPFLGSEGVNHKLIDGIRYLSAVKSEIANTLKQKAANKHAGQHVSKSHIDLTYMPLDVYGRHMKKQKSDKTIAIVYVDGMILRNSYNISDDSDAVWDYGEDFVIRGLRQARHDPEVKAIILRLNTGGGSVIASETIWNEVKEIVAGGKPVIASMGDMAASGGYLIAAAASKIVADPATLTGSIGVFSGKLITSGFWDHLGVHWHSIIKNDNAAMWSSSHDFNEHQKKRNTAMVDEIYNNFQHKVMEGRNLSQEKVHELAKGRVWTGQQGYERGLVDALGGLTEAVAVAKKELKAEPQEAFMLEDFPKALTPFQKLVRLFSLTNMDSSGIQAWTQQFAGYLGFAPRNILEAEHLRITGN